MSKRQEHFNTYKQNVRLWRAKYPIAVLPFDPLSFSVSAIKCNKEGCKRKSAHRHHKGHEYLFACLDEETYAKRYIEFGNTDVVWLCKKCHKAIHRLYQKLIDELFNWITFIDEQFDVASLMLLKEFVKFNISPKELIQGPLETKRQLFEIYRLRLIEKCERWLARTSQKREGKKDGLHNKQKGSNKGSRADQSFVDFKSRREVSNK